MDTVCRSNVRTRWSFARKNVEECRNNFSSAVIELLQKDVIPTDKLQALISDECLDPALIMQIRSSGVRAVKNKNRFSISNAKKKIRQEEAIKKNEKRRQMVLVNREIIKLNKDFHEKQKFKTKEVRNKQCEERNESYKYPNLSKVDKLRTRKPLRPPNSAKISSSFKEDAYSHEVQNKSVQNENKAKYEIPKLHDIEEDISLIIDSFKNNINQPLNYDGINGDGIETAVGVEIKNINNITMSKLEEKYFNMWIHIVKKRKQIKQTQESNFTRQIEISRFFELLKQQKKLYKNCENKKLLKCNSRTEEVCPEVSSSQPKVNEFSSFRHRYIIQKNVIALQKCKLEEQNRIIEELKLNKIVDATKQSMDNLKDEVKESYHKFERDNKSRVKCLANEAEVQPEETGETNNTLELYCLKVPKFIQRMEQRAKEREEKHAVIRERRKQMEEERIRLKQQAELLKAEMDEEEKMIRIEELREKRRAEKLEKIRRRKEQERTRTLTVMADLHYEKKLLYLCMETWLNEVKLTKQKVELAKKHRKEKLKRSSFKLWKKRTNDTWQEIKAKADNFYYYKLLDRSMAAWKMVTYETTLNKQVAEDWYDFNLMERVIQQWHNYALSMRHFRIEQLEMSKQHYEGKLLWNVWCSWRTLPAINALKREQEVRKMKWRKKVLQVVPDYVPPEDY